MIQANELRIGNWVIDHLDNYYKIKASSIVAQLQFELAEQVGYKPIPLTEEILLKCGFEKINSFKEWTKRNKVLKDKSFNFPIYDHQNTNMYLYSFIGDNYFFYNGTHVLINHMPHLHQLQNLFYSLCGQELNVKL